MDAVVSFLEKKEMNELKIDSELEEFWKRGIITEHFPIVDTQLPEDKEAYKELVKKVVELYLNGGKRVLAHCRGGLGRAGTFASACLIYSGVNPRVAIDTVRKAR